MVQQPLQKMSTQMAKYVYPCPVCGYEMPDPAVEGEICSCCGTEFGYDDDDLQATYDQLRQYWLHHGAPWFSHAVAPPYGWDPVQQVILAGFDVEFPDPDATTERVFVGSARTS